MASIIPGYEYDIFISYRQKDNKGDRWVSEFVNALKDELESTFKEDISIYFDENPHDRLQDTHNVDKSLEGKLKCLIFIPIVSQTYCDPRSYAWQYEFLAFNILAEKDQYGKDVKLKSGNVTSRILPIRIHDLDAEDVKLYEKESGSVLRALDFVFKTSSGVNRPLTPSDNPDKNLNKTFYRDQINKVANAIKEIISGLKPEPVTPLKEKTQQKETPGQVSREEKSVGQGKPLMKLSKRMLISGISIIAILVIAAVMVYPKIFKQDRLEYLRSKGKISVAVMPFKNMTNDTTKNSWQDLIQYNLSNSISTSDELEVRQVEFIANLIKTRNITNYASLTPTVTSSIAKKLDTDVFIDGSIGQAGPAIRINAQIVDTKTKVVFKPFQIDIKNKDIINFEIIDSLSIMIKEFLAVSNLKKETSPTILNYASITNSSEAYSYFILGKKAFEKTDYPSARKFLSQALAIDSNYFYASTLIAMSYGNTGLFIQAKEVTLELYKRRNIFTLEQRIYLDFLYAGFFETPLEEITYMKQLIEIDEQVPNYHYLLGNTYYGLDQYYNAISEYEKALEIYDKWGSKPWWAKNYTSLGKIYYKTGQLSKENKLYKKAEKDFPDDPYLIYRQAVHSLTKGKTKAANVYIEKYISILKGNSATEAAITENLAGIYSEAGILDKADEYYREALSLQSDGGRLNTLAYFLIDNDRDIKEGLELANRALEISPDNYNFLHTKGWGLFKQGNYKEALDILQKSWDLRMQNGIYSHDAFLHLEEARKAVASQKTYN